MRSLKNAGEMISPTPPQLPAREGDGSSGRRVGPAAGFSGLQSWQPTEDYDYCPLCHGELFVWHYWEGYVPLTEWPRQLKHNGFCCPDCGERWENQGNIWMTERRLLQRKYQAYLNAIEAAAGGKRS